MNDTGQKPHKLGKIAIVAAEAEAAQAALDVALEFNLSVVFECVCVCIRVHLNRVIDDELDRCQWIDLARDAD